MTIGYLQRGVFTAGAERASLLIRASIRCYPPATEQYADFADRRIYPRMLRIAADLPADYADFTNGFWGLQIDGFSAGLGRGASMKGHLRCVCVNNSNNNNGSWRPVAHSNLTPIKRQ